MAQRTIQHTRIVWAPPAITRLKAVRSELETLNLIEGQRMLTSAEHRYHEHLVRRAEELQDEAVREARQKATAGAGAGRY